MTSLPKSTIEQEFALSRALLSQGNHAAAFTHLERAHVLGQARVLTHVRSHWMMLKLELGRRQSLAAMGQAVRIVFAALGSAIGVVPTGNTGGTNVSMFRRMSIDPELLAFMQSERAATIAPRAEPSSARRPTHALAGKVVALVVGMLIGAAFYGFAPELIRTGSDEAPVNFVATSDRLHTSGQPSRAQLLGLKDKGYGLVINLAPPTTIGSIEDEGRLVGSTGISYLNIPTDWHNPSHEDFELFSNVLRQSGSRQVLIHCQINRRASVFTFLYQVIHEGEDADQAYAKVTGLWVPDREWREFARMVLRRNGIAFEPY